MACVETKDCKIGQFCENTLCTHCSGIASCLCNIQGDTHTLLPGCLLCQNTLDCTKCAPNSLQLTNTCVSACPDNTYEQHNTCLACDNTTPDTGCICNKKQVHYCTSCSSSECVSCLQNFAPNASKTACIACSEGEISPDGKLCKASNCSPHCITCTDTACTACENGYTLNNDVCIPCFAHCDVCELVPGATGDLPLPTTCTTCAEGYQTTQTACKPCSEDCKICKDKICQICFDGYFLVEDACEKCVPNSEINEKSPSCTCGSVNTGHCGGCSMNSGHCGYCLTGYGLTITGKCEVCQIVGPRGNCVEDGFCADNFCADCGGGIGQCRVCQGGFLMDINGVCVKDCAGIQRGFYCKQNENLTIDPVSTVCPIALELVNLMTTACKCGTSENCANCDITDVQRCGMCLKGYGKNEIGNCVLCVDGFLMNRSNLRCYEVVEAKGGLSGGAIAGIVVACVVLVAGIVGLGVWLFLFKRGKKQVWTRIK